MTLAELKEWHRRQAEAATTRAQNWRSAAEGLKPKEGGTGWMVRADRYVAAGMGELDTASFHATAAELIEEAQQ